MNDSSVFKFLREDGSAAHGGKGKWKLPQGDKPGAWMPAIKGDLIPCEHGYHLCRWRDLPTWCAPALYEAEYDGEVVEMAGKIVVRRARLIRKVETWNERTMRLWACDCAEHVLHIFEQKRPDDKRPHEAIAVARRYANREGTGEELAAAWDAATAAAWAAAWAAARAAAWDAATDAAWAAAWAAARATAWDAAWAAARATAGAAATDAEKAWQFTLLKQYLNGEIA